MVTPSLNQGRFIERTIRSVIEQDYDDLEYIVVDGDSTDDTLAVLRRYGDRVVWISEPDRGQSDAINKGWRMSSGEIVAYLNSDDTYKPGAVARAVEWLLAEPETVMVYSDVDIIDQDDRLVRLFRGPEFDLDRLIHDYGYYLPQQGVFLARAALERVGLLDESLHFKMDRDLYIRMGRQGRVRRIPQSLACGRAHADAKSTPRNEDRAWREFVALRGRYGAPVPLASRVRHYLETRRRSLSEALFRYPLGRRLITRIRQRNFAREIDRNTGRRPVS